MNIFGKPVPTKEMKIISKLKNSNSGHEMKYKNSRKLKWQLEDILNKSTHHSEKKVRDDKNKRRQKTEKKNLGTLGI